MAGYLTRFKVLRSIHGRALAISSSRGLVMAPPTTAGSSDVNCTVQCWGPGMFYTSTATTATIPPYGVSFLSGATGAFAYTLSGPPEKGQRIVIHLETSGTLGTLDMNSTLVLFRSTASFTASGGATTITITGSSLGTCGTLALVGLSTTLWALDYKSLAAT